MSSFKFEPDRAGIEDVVNGPGVADYLTAVAKDAADRIRRRAPHGRDAFFNYWKSVRHVPATRGPDGTLEAAAGSDSPGWHLAEYGTERLAPLAPIRRGVEEVGIKIEGGSR